MGPWYHHKMGSQCLQAHKQAGARPVELSRCSTGAYCAAQAHKMPVAAELEPPGISCRIEVQQSQHMQQVWPSAAAGPEL